MKKKIIVLLVLFISVLGLTGCNNKSALEFKEDYESLNGQTNKSGKEHRTIKISKDNPFEKVEAKRVVEMIDNKESFYLYIGDPLCPWCRSVIEKAIEVAKNYDIKKIYYIDIWDEDGNEIFRSKYILNDNKETEEVIKGTEEYYKLLDVFKDKLNKYTLTDTNGEKVDVGEYRIFAPSFFYIKDGNLIKMTEGISDKQKDAREELTKEMLDDEQSMFNELFNN